MKKINILQILVILIPVWFLLGLQSLLFAGSYVVVFKNIIFGVLIGCIINYLFSKISFFNNNFHTLKIVSLLFPCLLMLGYISSIFQTIVFYCIFLILYFVLIYWSFLRKIYPLNERIGYCISLITIFFVIWFCVFSKECFSPDSYSYFEMSKKIFSDFGKINTYRQYTLFTSYGVSFPYLYPTLIAIVNFFTELGIYSGIIINVIVSLLTVCILIKFSKKYFKTVILGTVTSLMLLCNPYYLNEVMAARAIPATILCTITILYLLFEIPKVKSKNIFFAGLLAGASMVIRFDALITAGCGMFLVFIFCKVHRIKYTLLYGLGVLIFTCPWVCYSLIFFGRLWASDNIRTALLIYTENPLRCFSSQYQPLTLLTDPILWIKTLIIVKCKKIIIAFIDCIIRGGAIFGALWSFYNIILSKKFINSTIKSNKNYLKVAFIVMCIYLIKTIMLILVGYGDIRYHLETWLMIVLFVSGVIINTLQNAKKLFLKMSAIVLISLTVGVVGQIVLSPIIADAPIINNFVYPYGIKLLDTKYVLDKKAATVPDDVAVITEVVKKDYDDPRVLFLSGNPYKFGAYTGFKTFANPVVDEQNDILALYEIIDKFIKPDYIIAKDIDNTLITIYQLEKISKYQLVENSIINEAEIYKVCNKSTFSLR